MDHHPTTTTTEPLPQPQSQPQPEPRTEGERLLGIASKLLQTRDLTGSREFALLAQETEPLLDQTDQIIAITDVLLASEKRVSHNHRQNRDYYSILQTDRRSDPDLIRKNYRRLALLLHPDRNRFAHADVAFNLVADAWSILSDPDRRASYDAGSAGEKDKHKLPVRRSNATANANFWTTCPYCYVIYEFPRVYIDCCIRCNGCDRGFHAVAISELPPLVPGKEAYYCSWAFFPMGFEPNNNNNNTDNPNNSNSGFPKWMPSGPGESGAPGTNNKMGAVRGVVDFSSGNVNVIPSRMSDPGAKKRGRPRKNPLGF